MAEIRAFRALRYDPRRADPALAIAPPYDVISPDEQRALYERSPHNIVRVEYGEERPDDHPGDDRYTRAARDLQTWLSDGLLTRDREPSMYRYLQQFEWRGRLREREAVFAAVRLEPWESGVIRPHEHTLSAPKADRLALLRATRTQVSPAYGIFRPKPDVTQSFVWPYHGETLFDATADGQRHVLNAVSDPAGFLAFARRLAACDVYIADGHHRYETALAYRDEVRDGAREWTGDEPENFVLMALTRADDSGLLVLPTHRIVRAAPASEEQMARIEAAFGVEDLGDATVDEMLARIGSGAGTRFVAVGLRPGVMQMLTLRDRAAAQALMPTEQPPAWKRLDVSVFQYAVLQAAFGIDDTALAKGESVTYTQDARAAYDAASSGGNIAFLLNATPVDQVVAVADAGGRMPQKSTYFYPKLATGIVMYALSDR